MNGHKISVESPAFLEQISSYLNYKDFRSVQSALEMAHYAHGDQRRKSGEPFFTHPLTVAYYLSEYRLDAPALAAALLHDVAEDTRVSLEEIEAEFGQEVSLLVDGVTKLKDVTKGVVRGKTMTRQAIQDATLRKLLAVMTIDIRAVIIKIFDRVHNLRTIKAMPYHKQVEKAKETLTVYAPLANRLGIWRVKNELEAISLDILNNHAYQIITHRLTQLEAAQLELVGLIRNEIFNYLVDADIDVRSITTVPKQVYDVFLDLSGRGVAYHNVSNITSLKVLVKDLPSCYAALGHLHQVWQPVPGNFDDYIAVPRDNLYRSLHTTVVHHNGQHIKLQIRTPAMDKVSEIGVLTRWRYADSAWWPKEIAARIDTFFENIMENISLEPQNPSVAVRGVVEDVFRKQIRVYTPRGDGVSLAEGATPIDFAYTIHTGLGDQCHAAYVNEEIYPLNKPLKDGDKVRIVKKLKARPRRAWLDEDLGYARTNYARYHIRRWFRRLSDNVAIFQGKRLLQRELNMLGLRDYSHEQVATLFEHPHITPFYYRLGRAELLPTVVATRILEETWGRGPSRDLDDVAFSAEGEKFIIMNAEGRKLHLCGTCTPRPPEAIIGFIRKSGQVTVHRQGCHTIQQERYARRLLKLGWGKATLRQARLVTLQIDVYDRPGLLYEITHLLHDEQINISYIHTPPELNRGETRLILTLEVVHPRHLVRILHQIQALVNVYEVQILLDGPPDSQDYLPASLYRPE